MERRASWESAVLYESLEKREERAGYQLEPSRWMAHE